MSQYEFRSIYEDYKENVWRWVSRFVYSRPDREDLFQEIFLKVHKSLGGFRGSSGISTWIYRITVNASINYLKKQKRHKTMATILSSLRIIETESLDNYAEVDLSKPMEKLNEKQRTILLLSDVEEKQLEDISEIMRLPVGTVKSNLHRAREIIRRHLTKNG